MIYALFAILMCMNVCVCFCWFFLVMLLWAKRKSSLEEKKCNKEEILQQNLPLYKLVAKANGRVKKKNCISRFLFNSFILFSFIRDFIVCSPIYLIYTNTHKLTPVCEMYVSV